MTNHEEHPLPAPAEEDIPLKRRHVPQPEDAGRVPDEGKRRRVPSPPTPEQRAQAVKARRASIQAGKLAYRQDFLEAPRWTQLATAAGVRLPAWHIAPTPHRLALGAAKLLRGKQGSETPVEAGKPGTFADLFGCSPARLIALNKDWPLQAFLGLLLEASTEQSGKGTA